MDLTEAWSIFHEYYGAKELTELDQHAFIEASELLIYHEELDDCDRMPVLFNLASFYYDCEEFPLSEKYYTMLAEEYDYDGLVSSMAHTALAKLYFYGHKAGTSDYQQAYEHTKTAIEKDEGSLQAKVLELMIARHGVGTIDEEDYCDAVFDLSDEVFGKNVPGIWSIPIPEIILLVCEIFMASDYEDENTDPEPNVHDLLKDAKSHLFHRLLKSRNPDDLLLMKEIIDFNPLDVSKEERMVYDLMDMLYWGDAEFMYGGKKYIVHTEDQPFDGEVVVSFEGKYFRSPYEFLRKAVIENMNLNMIADRISEIDWIE